MSDTYVQTGDEFKTTVALGEWLFDAINPSSWKVLGGGKGARVVAITPLYSPGSSDVAHIMVDFEEGESRLFRLTLEEDSR